MVLRGAVVLYIELGILLQFWVTCSSMRVVCRSILYTGRKNLCVCGCLLANPQGFELGFIPGMQEPALTAHTVSRDPGGGGNPSFLHRLH